jgi:hypothetical protein
LNKKMMLAAAIFAAAAIGGPATAQPGQCSVTGWGTFDCDVVVDGGGFSFGLPDGAMLAFTLTEPDIGLAYLIPADSEPGQRPRPQGEFQPVNGKPGCWANQDGYEFCAMVFEGKGT